MNPALGWTTGGEHVLAQLGSNAKFELKNFWMGGWWIARRFGALTTGALRGGPAVYRPSGWQANLAMGSDRRKTVTLGVHANGSVEDGTDSWNVSASPNVTVRPSSQLNLSVGPMVGRSHNTWQYVGQPRADGNPADPRYVVATLDQTTVGLTARLNYTISPELSFEFYAQPHISGGDYETFRTLGNARSRSFDERFRRLDGAALTYDAADRLYRADTDGDGALDVAFANPDFNFRQMRGNAVLRWEYRPGSTLYLVWSRARTGFDSGDRASLSLSSVTLLKRR